MYNSIVSSSQTISILNPKIIAELKRVVGDENVLTDEADLFLYSYDAALDRARPSAVVLPGTPEQVAAIVQILAGYKKPYVARGAATSLAGGPIALHGAVVIGLARLKVIGRVDKVKSDVSVEAGVVNLHLQRAVEPLGLFFPPDPGSQKACTVGGNVATNAGGPHCLKYGVTSHFVASVEVVLPQGGTVNLRTEDPGYDLAGFFCGTEGTLGIATRMRVRLLKKPAVVRTMLASFSTMDAAIQAVTDIIAAGLLPATIEAMDRTIIEAVEAFMHCGYPNAEAVLLIETDGDKVEELDKEVVRIQDLCLNNGSIEFRFAKTEEERVRLWEGRRGAYASMARLAPNVLVEDGAVPRTKLPEALRAIRKIADDAGLRVAMLFHAGDGNLHPQIIFDERNAAQTRVVKEAGMKMLKACVDLGGTISGEHGIGIDKREAMKWLFTRDTLAIFRRLKNAFDPDNICNPDKLIPLVSRVAVAMNATQSLVNLDKDGTASPKDEIELVEMVRTFAASKSMYGLQGLRTKMRVREPRVIRLGGLNRILEVDRANLTVTAQAGAKLEDVRAAVEKEGRFLWVSGTGSVGGTVATRSSVAPPLRDQILAMRVLFPTGETGVFGAKTMKNVAGYDVPKLLIGSWGTLGIILDVTFKLFPFAPPSSSADRGRPFVLRDLHRRIKKALDPDGILSPQTTAFTDSEVATIMKETPEPLGADPGPATNYGDKFWI